MRFASLAGACLTVLLFGCAVEMGLKLMSAEQLREVRREKEPECFKHLNECDTNGMNCKLARDEYVGSDGVTVNWAACDEAYSTWLARNAEAWKLLRTKDPTPRCLRLGSAELKALGFDPDDPDAIIELARGGYEMGGRQCTDQWCTWLKRNQEVDEPLPETCTDRSESTDS